MVLQLKKAVAENAGNNKTILKLTNKLRDESKKLEELKAQKSAGGSEVGLNTFVSQLVCWLCSQSNLHLL